MSDDEELAVTEDKEAIQERANRDFAHYRLTLAYLGANVPIEVLCLPKVIESILIREGFLRLYDLIGADLAKIKGLGKSRIDLLAARLDEFFTVSI